MCPAPPPVPAAQPWAGAEAVLALPAQEQALGTPSGAPGSAPALIPARSGGGCGACPVMGPPMGASPLPGLTSPLPLARWLCPPSLTGTAGCPLKGWVLLWGHGCCLLSLLGGGSALETPWTYPPHPVLSRERDAWWGAVCLDGSSGTPAVPATLLGRWMDAAGETWVQSLVTLVPGQEGAEQEPANKSSFLGRSPGPSWLGWHKVLAS